jgi:pimeloyl-ACP methyl ester carboxylesterase
MTKETEGMFFDSDGVRIHYLEEGAGEPVVLVHSFMGSVETVWRKTGIFQALARDYRVIAIDCRGHGQSDKPYDPKQYGAQMAKDVLRLLDHLGVGKVHIVGYSMGANIAAILLTTKPERLVSAVLGGAPGRIDWREEDNRRVRVEADEIEKGMLRTQTRRLSPPGSPPPSEEEIKRFSERLLKGQDLLALAAVRRASPDQAIEVTKLAAVAVPTLGIVGSKDPYLQKFESLKRRMPQLKLTVIDGATHTNALKSSEFVRAVKAFLASRSLSGR